MNNKQQIINCFKAWKAHVSVMVSFENIPNHLVEKYYYNARVLVERLEPNTRVLMERLEPDDR